MGRRGQKITDLLFDTRFVVGAVDLTARCDREALSDVGDQDSRREATLILQQTPHVLADLMGQTSAPDGWERRRG